jgi:hypothetical protein
MAQLNKHPILRECYNVCQAIEACAAGTNQTNASILASNLLSDCEMMVDELRALKDELRADADVARKWQFLYVLQTHVLLFGARIAPNIGTDAMMGRIVVATELEPKCIPETLQSAAAEWFDTDLPKWAKFRGEHG